MPPDGLALDRKTADSQLQGLLIRGGVDELGVYGGSRLVIILGHDLVGGIDNRQLQIKIRTNRLAQRPDAIGRAYSLTDWPPIDP